MIVGINALRARSGGSVTHLIEVLSNYDWNFNSDIEVHVWTYKKLVEKLPKHKNLKYHSYDFFDKSVLIQLIWEILFFSSELKKYKCGILLNIDAGKLSRYSKMVTMSRDMLSYEPGELSRFRLSKAKIRLILLKFVQNNALKASNGVIFLTHYASEIIQKSTGKLLDVAYIPHGVSRDFDNESKENIIDVEGTVKCLYVSNIAPYKHHWNVVRAVKLLRDRGYKINLTITGGGHVDSINHSQKKLDIAIEECDPELRFINLLGFICHTDLPDLLKSTDIFIFASSCENMPNTLVEAMKSKLPIACSNRGPMPEILGEGGVYFNPESYTSIADSIEEYLRNPSQLYLKAKMAYELSLKYTWNECATKTFNYLRYIYIKP